MKKRWGILLLAFCLLGLTACAAGKLDTEKIRDIEFTVLSGGIHDTDRRRKERSDEAKLWG